MNKLSKYIHLIFNKIGICFLCLVLFCLFPGLIFSLDNEEEESKRREQHFVRFPYTPEIVLRATKGGKYNTHATPRIPTAEQIHTGQTNIKKTLGSLKGKPLTVGDTLKVYASAREAGFHAVHGCHGEEGITPQISRELGLGRQKFHEEVLIELAKSVEGKTKGLGVNDFGSGADPAKINAKGDIDFTLYAKNTGVEAQWLVDQYNSLFKEIARKRYGVDITPVQMDIVAHRYDATIPDWRTREGIADFEIKLRTGTTLLKANPEAYFLEGAYLQQVMNRSMKAGKKTFTWYIPDSSAGNGVRHIRVNAAQVPQFFYVPKARKALGFGGAVANYHFHYAHAGDFIAKAKHLLRSLDNGPGLLMTGKRGDYQDIGKETDVTEGKPDPVGKKERRQIIDDLYDSPQMRYSKDLRDEIFEAYEICRKARIAKDKRLNLSDAQLYGDLMAHMKKHSLVKIDDATALKMAKQTFTSASEFILTSNVIRTAKTRARDWLRPHTLKERISYEDEDGNLVSVVAKKADLEKLQFAAFREIHDAIQILQQDKKQHVIDQLKEQNPLLKKDIEIIENIIRKKREMMAAPETETPEAATDFRQKAAQAVIDSWEQMGKAAPDSSLWNRSLTKAQNAWATGQALESYLYANLTQAVIFSGGRKYGPVLEQMRQTTEETNKGLMDPIWMTRISRANSVVHVLTLYVQEGSCNEKVIKEAIVEGLSHFPLIGMPIDIYRGTVSGLLNYKGGVKDLVKATAGSGLGQIVMSQFIPGYGPVILVVNTAKGVVNLGGTVLFAPLKDQRIKLAYQGYLDPVDIEPGSPLYKSFLEQTGTQGVRNAVAWWMDSTGRKDRIYSPRPSVLHPIDPEMKMSLEDRRKAVLAYFQPQIAALFKQRWGGAAEVHDQPLHYSEIESEFLPKIMYKHIHEWWEGTGKFSAYDSLAVKRMMDEYYSDEMKSKLTHLLISDYIAGKGELIKDENEWYESLKRLIAAVSGYFESHANVYKEDYPAISDAHQNAAMQVMGLEQEEAEQISPRIEILSSPRVILGKNEEGDKTTIIEKINIRAKVQASDTPEHPAPFDIRFKIKSGDKSADLSENRTFSVKFDPDQVPDVVTVAVIAYDANNQPFVEHDVTIPILDEKASSEYDGGESLEEVFDRLEALAKKAEEMVRDAAKNADKAGESLKRASAAFGILMSTKERMKSSLPEAERCMQQSLELIKSIGKELNAADGNARNLDLLVSQALELSREICRSLTELQAQPSRRAELLQNIRLKRQTLSSLLPKGRNHKSNYVASIQTVKNDLREMGQQQGTIGALVDQSKDRLDEGAVLDQLIEADIASMAVGDNAETIKDIIVDADIEYAKGKEFIAQRPVTEGKPLAVRLERLVERIRKADQTAVTLKSSLEGKVEKINRNLQFMSREIGEINAKIDVILKHYRETKAVQERFTQQSRTLETGRASVEEDLVELETAALDADICSESAQNTGQVINQNLIRTNEKCNQITQELNDARRRGDSQTYGRLLNLYRECSQYTEAQAIYNNMIQTDQRCNEITRRLNDAQQRSDLQTFQSLLNSYRDCNHYDQALANYNAMVQASHNQFCNDLLHRLNNAQSRGDIAAYGSLLNQATQCGFYNEARNIYNGMKNRQNMQALNAFVGAMSQMLNQQNTKKPSPPTPSPPRPAQPPRNKPPVTKPPATSGGSGMSQADCEKKFCPVCATGGSVDLLGVSVNQQCNDCRKKFKAKIEDCMRGGVSVNRPDVRMSQFSTYRVIKCKVPVKDDKGRTIRYREFYDFAGQNRKYPPKASCTVIGNGTWEECIDRARQYNSRYNTRYNVIP